jgi:hypothetical protein
MLDDDPGRTLPDGQDGSNEPRQGVSSSDSLSARTLTITLFAAIGILVVLLVLLLR